LSHGRTAARRRTAIATGLSVAGHAAIVVLIALDLDRGAGERAVPSMVEITLTPPERIPDRPPPPKQPPSAPRPRRPVASAMAPTVPASPLSIPAAPSSAPPAPPAGDDLPTALRTGCIGKRDLDAEARIDCKLEIWSVLDHKPRLVLPGDTIPDDKQAAWDVVARAQSRKRANFRPGGNATTIGCPQGNLGAGCLDEMLIPLIGSEAKK